MKIFRRGLFLAISLLAFCKLGFAETAAGDLRFTENKGQIIGTDGNLQPDILFKTQSNGADIYLTRHGISFVIVSQNESQSPFYDMEGEMAEKMKMRDAQFVLERIDLTFLGTNSQFDIVKEDPLASIDNFYLGHCPNGILNVKSYQSITYSNFYPGIDWKISTENGGLKTAFIVHLNADPSLIQFKIEGAEQTELLSSGVMKILGKTGEITDDAPFCIQGENRPTAEYRLQNNVFGFEIGDYDPSKTLIIDPYTRVYSTFFGGSSSEWYLGHVTTTDISGNMYLGGHTGSLNFPVTAGVFQGANAGGNDCFVGKFDNNGARIWATYFGGSSNEGGIAFKAGLCTDPTSNVWMASVSASTNFPVTAGAFQTISGGGNDAVLFKLNSSGVRQYATYFGGGGNESPAISRWGANSAPAIASDINGNIFMTGFTESTNLPVTAGCFQAANAGGKDAYLVKWSNAGARLYSTYYGGTSNEEAAAAGIAVDVAGNVWMTGSTNSSNLPITVGCFQPSFAGTFDQFLVKWNNACVRQYATYYGGSGDEGILCDVDVTATGDIWLGVFTQSTNFPVTATANQPTSAGGWEYGLVRFDNTGARLYASYFGSSAQEEPWDISVDKATGRVCLVGCTWGATLPTIGPPFQSTSAGSQEGTIMVFDPTGLPIYTTYYGGVGHDEAFSSVFDIFSNLWVSGMAASNSFPTSAGAFQTTNAGGTDPFLAKFVPPVILPQNEIDFYLLGLEGTEVELGWSNPNFEIVKNYHLERDLVGAWEEIAQVSTNGKSTFEYKDFVPTQGMASYRLRLEFQDGSFGYSQMLRVNIKIDKDVLLSVFPNPVKSGDEVFLNYQMKDQGNLHLEAFSLDGKCIMQKDYELMDGRSKVDFNTNSWAAGIYILQLKSANGQSQLKIQVE